MSERAGGPVSERAGGPLVVVERLSKVYRLSDGPFRKPRLVPAVDGVSFYVRRGETLGLVGESGCGKSTLARALLRLIEPTMGRIVFDGKDITKMPEAELRSLRRRMQIVFQDPYSSLNPRMTVGDIVGEGIGIFGLAPSAARRDELVREALERVGLGAAAIGRYPHEFSGGQRQRVGLARALAVRPDFLICDEPVSALDVSVQAQIVNLLMSLQDERSLSLLFISHDLRLVRFVSHRIAVMYLGRIVEMGPTESVAERRYHPYTRALFAEALGQDAVEIEPSAATDEGREGCMFFARCPKAEAGRCDVKAPPLSEVVPGSHHRVACYHPALDAK